MWGRMDERHKHSRGNAACRREETRYYSLSKVSPRCSRDYGANMDVAGAA